MTAIFSLAARREAQAPGGLPIDLTDEVTLRLPAELPVDVLDPFLSPDLDLAGVVAAFMDAYDPKVAKAEGKDQDDAIGEAIIKLLTERPSLPLGLVTAIYDAYKLLFGADQFALWKAERPSINEYAALTAALVPAYGVSLGKLFGSPEPSSAGTTSKPTSESTATSTRAKSGAAKGRTRASSASAA